MYLLSSLLEVLRINFVVVVRITSLRVLLSWFPRERFLMYCGCYCVREGTSELREHLFTH